jgi:hypothetical protein
MQSGNPEWLDLFFFGQQHLRHILSECAAHSNQERPHQARTTGRRRAKLFDEAAVRLPLPYFF